MKNLFLISIAFITMFLVSCEEIPQGTIKVVNEDNTSYECYFDSELIGTVNPLSTELFEVYEDCAIAKVESDDYNYGTYQKEICITGDNTTEFNVDEVPTTIEYDNWDNCSYDCYFDGNLLGTVGSYGNETFKVDVKTALAEVKSSVCGNGSVMVTALQDRNYVVSIDLDKKKSAKNKEGNFTFVNKDE